MAGLFSRIKTWIGVEDFTATDINAEFDNILNNLNADKIDDASANIAAMQTVFDPGDVGTENLPAHTAEELQSLRSILKKIVGGPQWYSPPSAYYKRFNCCYRD